MPKETILMTRDLFDEMIQAATDKERNRIIALLEEIAEATNTNRLALYALIALVNGDN